MKKIYRYENTYCHFLAVSISLNIAIRIYRIDYPCVSVHGIDYTYNNILATIAAAFAGDILCSYIRHNGIAQPLLVEIICS